MINDHARRPARRVVLIILCAILLGIVIFVWQLNRTAPLPSNEQLVAQAEKLASMGWSWLEIKDMKVVATIKESRGWRITFDYSVVVKCDESDLPDMEVERFRKFLPMCMDTPLLAGNSCQVTEELMFVYTDDYNWVPEIVLEYRKEMLPYIPGRKDL